MKNTNYTIYLADDDRDDREFFQEVLQEISADINFISFDNGVDLMKQLLDRNNKLPNFIFLDLNMPLMNGEECLDDIRSLSYVDNVPIIIYSTSMDPSKAKHLRERGANLYLKKPNTFNDLKLAVSHCLHYADANTPDSDGSYEYIVQL
jgi:response regulator RpfG family c-di-GMP phosphodiesterase